MTRKQKKYATATWHAGRVRLIASASIILPLIGIAVNMADDLDLGFLAIVAGFLITVKMPRGLRNIVDDKHDLDEREKGLRMKAYEFSYRYIVAVSAGIFLVYWGLNAYANVPLPDKGLFLGFGILIYFYSLIVPLAYLAWAVTPPETADE